jgi:nucleotide-binding universal stress UspA family protein
MVAGTAGIASMYEGHPESDRLNAAAEAQAAIEMCAERYPDVEVRIQAREGNAVDALNDAARGARLLVVARHRRRGPLAVGAGYVTDGVLAHSPVPVAVVPDP